LLPVEPATLITPQQELHVTGYARLARAIPKPCVAGSNPAGGTNPQVSPSRRWTGDDRPHDYPALSGPKVSNAALALAPVDLRDMWTSWVMLIRSWPR
jgi:hypothetical protein